jgi:hypothetical protein
LPLPRFAILRRRRGNSRPGGAKLGEEEQALIAALFVVRKVGVR